VGDEGVCHVQEKRDWYHEVVTVRLYEVVTRNGRRIYVVLSERPDEVL